MLIATLGSEPQVVTLALDLLLAKGYAIAEMIILHTAGEPVRQALARLDEEFAHPEACTYRTVPVDGDHGPVADIATERDVAALLRTLYRVVLAQKRAGHLVHWSLAGGRKPMAVYGMVVAQLLFDEDDRVWHLLTEGWRPGDERVMHIRDGAKAELIPVPVLRWSSVSPVLTGLALKEDPWEAIQAQRSIKHQEEYLRKKEFVGHWLTPAEREVVQLACQGLDNAAIGRHLHKSEKTVEKQFTAIYAKLHEWRGFREDVPIRRPLLVSEFAPYFSLLASPTAGKGKSLSRT